MGMLSACLGVTLAPELPLGSALLLCSKVQGSCVCMCVCACKCVHVCAHSHVLGREPQERTMERDYVSENGPHTEPRNQLL